MLLLLLLACSVVLSLLVSVALSLQIQSPLHRYARKQRSSESALNLFGKRSLPKVEDGGKTAAKGAKPKSGGPCSCCTGKGAVDCAVCAGTGKDKVNGNIFERWTCIRCKGFGLVVCPECSSSSGGMFKAGLTPEQT
jgi:hypothetical protein